LCARPLEVWEKEWGRRRRGVGCWQGANSLGNAILMQNSKESKNSKFETGFLCCEEVIFVKPGGQTKLYPALH
jgi:hypothetical protein